MPGGLFPAPLPQHDDRYEPQIRRAEVLFEFLGVYIGKALQDGRLVDLPFSYSFLKMLCVPHSHNDIVQQPDSRHESEWYTAALDFDDFLLTNPAKGQFFTQLRRISKAYRDIQADVTLSEEEKLREIELKCTFESAGGARTPLEELGLDFAYLPTSRVYGFRCVSLADGRALDAKQVEELARVPVVTLENAEELIERTLEFALRTGIRRQMNALRRGLSRVLSSTQALSERSAELTGRLSLFSPDELKLMLCGEQAPKWSREDLIRYTVF